MEQVLAEIEPGTRLQDPEMTEDRVASLVKPLYAILDDPATRPAGVQATTLSKILHRKRPQFLVLHDKWVRACYWGEDDDAIVKRDKTRPASDYMVAITHAIAADLIAGQYMFDRLIGDAPAAADLTRVRILDVLAWSSKGVDVA